MIGAPPPNFTFDFQSSKRIPPSFSVQSRLYNDAGFVPHPLQIFGQAGGTFVGYDRAPVAGIGPNQTGLGALIGGPVGFTG